MDEDFELKLMRAIMAVVIVLLVGLFSMIGIWIVVGLISAGLMFNVVFFFLGAIFYRAAKFVYRKLEESDMI